MEISNESRRQAITVLDRLVKECDLCVTDGERVGILVILSEEFEIAFQEGCKYEQTLKFLNKIGVIDE